MRTVTWLLVAALCSVTSAGAQDLLSTLKAQETKGWEAWKSQDGDAFRASTVEAFVDINSRGEVTAGRETLAAGWDKKVCKVASFSLADWQLHQVNETTALLTYTATQDAECNGQKAAPRVRAMAVYVKQGDRWLGASYHETAMD